MAASKAIRIVGLCGSLRAASKNAGLLRYAAAVGPSLGVEVQIADIGSLPLYNSDLEKPSFPSTVASLRAAVGAADAVIFACPEYNFSVTGVLKNAIDWLSRSGSDGSPAPLTGKPAGIVGGGGHDGSLRAQHALRQIICFLDMHPINKPEIALRFFDGVKRFDEATGDVTDEETKGRVAAFVKALATWTQTLQLGAAAVAAAAK